MATSGTVRPYGGQAHVYDFEYQAYTDDIPFYLERLHERGLRGPVLELGCGTGRVAIPLVNAGFQVTGIDLSEPMLRRARKRRQALTPEAAGRLELRRGDMSRFALKKSFEAAIIAFSSLALVPEAEQRARCLERVHAHLRPGGMLYIDLFAPRSIDPDQPEEPVHYTQSFRVPPYGHTIEKEVVESYDPDHRVKSITYTFRKKPYVGEKILSEFKVVFQMAVLSRMDVERILDAAGFEVESIYGDYRGRPFGAKSERMIFEARRR